MKYLRSYKLFESLYLENTSINWDVIESAKELSLDDIDEGSELIYHIDYKIEG